MPDREFRFRPPDRRAVWRGLSLTMSQAAALTGVSERQIQHWMDQGYISPSSEGTRKINGEGLDKILLIRQARAAGIPLRRAVSMAGEYLATEPTSRLDPEIAPPIFRDLDDRLVSLRSGIDTVQKLIRELEPHDGRTLPRETSIPPGK